MLKSLLAFCLLFGSSVGFSASGPMEPSEFSQDFLLIFDLNHSQKLEINELENAFRASSFGQALSHCASLENNADLAPQLWDYLFEKGRLPLTLPEKAAFLAGYSHQDHSQLTVDLKQVDRALSTLQNTCMR